MHFWKDLEVWVAVSAICFVIELFFAARQRQAGQAKTIRTDLAYWIFSLLGSVYIQAGLAVIIILAISAVLPDWIDVKHLATPRDTIISRQPLWLQLIEMLVIGDFVAYWVHRACHRGLLWRFHTIHHSSPHINWMSVYRVHPLNDFLIRFPPLLVFVLLGFNVIGAFVYGPVLAFYGAMEHMNVDWTFGHLKKIFTSPVFHRWHHTTEKEGLDKNFAPLLPIYDILFGTYYMPPDKRPETYGIKDETLPESFLKQMIYPFKKRPRRYAQPYNPPHNPPQY